jgi:peptidoglycan/LPS O-acetylase OafA/YrhL
LPRQGAVLSRDESKWGWELQECGSLLLFLQTHGLFTGTIAKALSYVGSGCAYIGRHSYSIYLWHAAYLQLVEVTFRKWIPIHLPVAVLAVINVGGACLLGIAFAHAIEFPVLKFRDRFFPMLQKPVEPTVPAVTVEATAGEPA